MSENGLVLRETGGGLMDDNLIAVAKIAEARVDAVIKIKQLSLKVTNGGDWTDQGGKPYLMVSGAEKIANLFNISWSFITPEPVCEEDEDGHYTYTFQGRFSMGERTIEIEGSRSSRDKFFSQVEWVNGQKVTKPVHERDNRRDVKMAALTNMLGNGITRILGIRNLTWEDLQQFAGIRKDDCGKVEYKKTDKPPLTPPTQKPVQTQPEAPQSTNSKNTYPDKGNDTTSVPDPSQPVKTTYIKGVEAREGEKNNKKYIIYGITDEDDMVFKTFDKKFADIAQTAAQSGLLIKIGYKVGKFGNDVVSIISDTAKTAGGGDVPF